MKVHSNRSINTDLNAAIAEATAGAAAAPDVVFYFASSSFEPTALSAAMARRFERSLVVGCSTTGEMLNGVRATGSLSVAAVESPGTSWAARAVPLQGATPAQLRSTVDALYAELGIDRNTFDVRKYFCLLLIDGLSLKQESFTAMAAAALDGIALVGGSAGDDLKFQETYVFLQGQALKDHAVLILCDPKDGFTVFKHQHFLRTTTSVVITAVDETGRRVLELDGINPADAYADALGVPRNELTEELVFVHPIILATEGDLFLRSVQKIHPDGTISFLSALEEGMVLDIAGHEDMVSALSKSVDEFLSIYGKPSFFVGFNCILRALEMSGAGVSAEVAESWRRLACDSIGFDTYGEQCNGLHINQTLVGVALH